MKVLVAVEMYLCSQWRRLNSRRWRPATIDSAPAAWTIENCETNCRGSDQNPGFVPYFYYFYYSHSIGFYIIHFVLRRVIR